jgi:hypothetical protein
MQENRQNPIFVLFKKKKIESNFKPITPMRLYFSCFLLLSVFNVFSQEEPTADKVLEVKIDSLYREDQFYFGLTFNTLQNKLAGMSQNKLSTGISAGFLRDMPVNKNRNIAFATGIGFTFDNYNQNLGIREENGKPVYTVIANSAAFTKNKFSQLLVNVPIELRWRTSTFESYKFWRIYGGVKLSYLIYDRSVFSDNQGKVVVSGNKDFNKFLYGAYISSGYNTINVYVYYGLNSLFKSAKIDDQSIAMKPLNIGVIFYIL